MARPSSGARAKPIAGRFGAARRYKAAIIASIAYRGWVLSSNIVFSFLDRYSALLLSIVASMAVALILDGPQAEAILQEGSADLIAIGRQALYDPFWALHAAQELGCDSDFGLWTPEYGWWLEKRKNNLVGLKK